MICSALLFVLFPAWVSPTNVVPEEKQDTKINVVALSLPTQAGVSSSTLFLSVGSSRAADPWEVGVVNEIFVGHRYAISPRLAFGGFLSASDIQHGTAGMEISKYFVPSQGATTGGTYFYAGAGLGFQGHVDDPPSRFLSAHVGWRMWGPAVITSGKEYFVVGLHLRARTNPATLSLEFRVGGTR